MPDKPLVFVILLLGLGLRLTGLWWGQGYFYFGQGDAIEAYSVAVDYAQGDARAKYIAQPNFNERSKLPGPLWTMFCFAGLRLWGSMDGVMLELILLNTATVLLIWLLVERTLGSPASLWAALLTATLPTPVFYSVGVYNPEIMPFLGTLLLLALWEVTQHERSRHVFWIGLLLSAMPQFHMSGLSLLPTVVIVLVLADAGLNVPWLLGGIVAGLLIYVPYLLGDGAHGWQNTIGMFGGKGGRTWDSLKAITIPFNFLVNFQPQWTHSFAAYREVGRACFGWFGLLLAFNILSMALAAGQGVGAFQLVRAAVRGHWRSPRQMFRRSPGIIFLAVILIVPLFSALLSGKPFHTRYALVLLPAVAALAGAGTAQALRWPQFGKCMFAAAVLTTCVNVWFMPAFYLHQAREIAYGDLFVPGFRKLETVYQKLKTHSGGNRAIKVDDADYLRTLSPEDTAHREASLIRRYIVVREKETRSIEQDKNPPASYKLCRTDEAPAVGAVVGFGGNGIALILKEAAPVGL
jgi:hypothetical protein